MGLALLWAVGTEVGEKVAWRIADRFISVSDHLSESTLRKGIGQYLVVTDHMVSRLDDEDYTWDQAKPDLQSMLSYQMEVLRIADSIIASYLYSHKEE